MICSPGSSAAARRYTLRMFCFAVAYVAVILAVGWTYHHHQMPDGALRYAIAAAPALPILGVIWAMQRFVDEETDEYQRMLQARIQAMATGVTLALCTAWGFLEVYADVPKVGMMYVFMIYVLALIPCQMWVHWRAAQ